MFANPRRPASASQERRSHSASRQRSRDSEDNQGPSQDPILGGGARGIRALRKQRDDGASTSYAATGASDRERSPLSPLSNQNNYSSRNTSERDRPSSASARRPRGGVGKVDLARRDLAERVDPLMSEIINYLLLEQPEAADQAILQFLEARRSGAPPPRVTARRAGDGSRHAVTRDRLYMARSVQPVLEKLMRRVVEEQPEDVPAHFIKQLRAHHVRSPPASAAAPAVANEVAAPPSWNRDTPTPAAPVVADVALPTPTPLPSPPNRYACDALFRMLDEDGEGWMQAATLVARMTSLRAVGVPIESTAASFWLSVRVDDQARRLNKHAFFAVMCSAVDAADQWFPVGDKSPPLLSKHLPLEAKAPETINAAPPVRPQPVVMPAVALEPVQQVVPPAAATAAATPTPVAAAPGPAAAAVATRETPPVKSSVAPAAGALAVGTRVTVNYKRSGNFYPGKIAKVNTGNTYDIAYDDGDSEKAAKREHIFVSDGESAAVDARAAPAAPTPTSPVSVVPTEADNQPASSGGVEVGTAVTVNYRKSGNWYPGKIAVARANGTYDIAYDDGDSERAVKSEHIKVDGKLIVDPSTTTAAAAPLATSALMSNEALSGAALPAAAPATKLKMVVALLGVQGAGKSTLLRAMGGDPDPKPRPTTGFGQKKLPFELNPDAASAAACAPEVLVHWYDLPGGWQSKWAGYLGEVHAVVFVVDAAAEDATFEVAKQAFRVAVGLSDGGDSSGDGDADAKACARVVSGKPVLVLCNKQDVPGARSTDEVAAAFFSGGGEHLNMRALACSCHPLRAPGEEFDSRLEQGLEQLLSETAQRFSELDARVQSDQARADEARAAEKVERHRRVMTKVLAEKAFPPEGTPPQETFSEVDGYEFLAMELLLHDPQVPEKTRTAEEMWGLPLEGQRLAKLVGFQKMAMIMCADMINPENKPSKTTHTWAEVTAYVMDRREDAGLPRDLAD